MEILGGMTYTVLLWSVSPQKIPLKIQKSTWEYAYQNDTLHTKMHIAESKKHTISGNQHTEVILCYYHQINNFCIQI